MRKNAPMTMASGSDNRSVKLRAAVMARGRAPVCSLSHRERAGVRGQGLSIGFEPPHPNPLPDGERERTESAATSVLLIGSFVDQQQNSPDVSARFRQVAIGKALLRQLHLVVVDGRGASILA